jgi:hypothetical protein
VTLAISGCASRTLEHPTAHAADARAPSRDAAADVPPPEENPIALTLWPFWDVPVDANGFGTPTPLDGVTVCIVRKRHYEEAWDRFVPTTGPCSKGVIGEKVTIAGVPAMSELVMTAEKPGYLPRAFALTTGQWDQDGTVGTFDAKQMMMFQFEAAAHFFPGADFSLGQVMLIAMSQVLLEAGPPSFVLPGGVSATLEPALGNEPFYFHGGLVAPGATSTAPGDFLSIQRATGVLFTSLPGGEYTVHLSANAPFGTFTGGGDSVFGYLDARQGVIRTPVLAGYFTAVAAIGFCRVWADPTTCAPSGADAGAP